MHSLGACIIGTLGVSAYASIIPLLVRPSPLPSTPLLPESRQIMEKIEASVNNTAFVIPGGSPFFYLDDPGYDIFQIESIAMSPTPCELGLPCSIVVQGGFQVDLDSIQIAVDIVQKKKDVPEPKPYLRGSEELCKWVDFAQHLIPSADVPCRPRQGPATLSKELLLTPAFIDEAIYWIDIKLMSGEQQLTHVGAKIDLKNSGVSKNQPSEMITS